jgi:hypothetical protein
MVTKLKRIGLLVFETAVEFFPKAEFNRHPPHITTTITQNRIFFLLGLNSRSYRLTRYKLKNTLIW